MNVSQRQAELLVYATPGFGPSAVWKILQFLPTVHASWAEFLRHESLWNAAGLNEAQRAALPKMCAKYSPAEYAEHVAEKNIQVIWREQSTYPQLLRETSSAPLCLFVQGDQTLLQPPLAVAIVGTRKMTEYGRFAAAKITQELCSVNAVIVSGLMFGVDLTAHQTVIKNHGKTVAVLGYGIGHLGEQPYLAADWLKHFREEGNVFVSEYAPETIATKGTFVQRNRIIAGLSHATVVVEAATKSGSLITARRAVEYNRQVCAVPGSIRSEFSDGTRELINQGATLVNSGFDVVHELAGMLGVEWQPEQANAQAAALSTLSPLGQTIVQTLHADQQTFVQLQEQLTADIPELQAELTQLEVTGWVIRRGAYWCLQTKV